MGSSVRVNAAAALEILHHGSMWAADGIEIHICVSEGTQNEDSPVQMFEVYI